MMVIMVWPLAIALLLPAALPDGYPIQQPELREVRLRDRFWLPALETNAKVSLWHALEQCEKTGRFKNSRPPPAFRTRSTGLPLHESESTSLRGDRLQPGTFQNPVRGEATDLGLTLKQKRRYWEGQIGFRAHSDKAWKQKGPT